MKLSSLIFLLIVISASALAQIDLEKHKWYKLKSPEFFRGQLGLQEYLKERIKLPYRPDDLKGEFSADYELDQNGNLHIINLHLSFDPPEFNKDILAWINFSKKSWTVASLNGKPIDSQINIRVNLNSSYASSNTFYWLHTNYKFIVSPLLANQYYNEGVKMFEAKDYAEAIKYFDETLYLTTKDIDALYNRAICKFKTGDKAGACEDWNRISSLRNADADGLISKYCN
jgi:tetratricopeptide (TPR) repeat protein